MQENDCKLENKVKNYKFCYNQMSKQFLELQSQIDDIINERDYYRNNLREAKKQHLQNMENLQKENQETKQKLYDCITQKEELERELNTEKLNLKHSQYDYDILQVDYLNIRHEKEDVDNVNRDLRRKIRNLQVELHEADKATTKRSHRLIDKLQHTENMNKSLNEIIVNYEKDLEELGLLCFVCRQGVQTALCKNCNSKCCKSCYESVEVCPFCRADLPTLQ